MNVLQRVGQKAEMQIYAYCLMGNHVHLLIREEFGTMQPSPGNAKDRAAFNLSVQRLLQAGISIRQLGRLTGLLKKSSKTVNRKETENRPLSPLDPYE